MTDDKFPSPDAEDDLEATSSDGAGDPQGELLGDDHLADPGDYEIAADETEAEELASEPDVDTTPDKADPEDVVIDDAEQLSDAEKAAAAARSSRPVRRKPKASTEVATATDDKPAKRGTAKKGRPTPKRDSAAVATRKRTTPVAFVGQSVGELKKVIWPTGEQLGNYFAVVLAFVLFIIAIVGLLDFGFGWALLKLFGAKPK